MLLKSAVQDRPCGRAAARSEFTLAGGQEVLSATPAAMGALGRASRPANWVEMCGTVMCAMELAAFRGLGTHSAALAKITVAALHVVSEYTRMNSSVARA